MGRPKSAPPPQTHVASARPEGALPDGVHELRRDGRTLACVRCSRRAVQGRWASLAYAACTADGDEAGEPAQWRRVQHVIGVRDGTCSCERCGGRVPAARRAAFEGRRCPARWLGEGSPGPGRADWGAWVHS
eukprot:7538276-Lingulodinium_polyedra.AAC.1